MGRTRAERVLCLVAALGGSALGSGCGEGSAGEATLSDSTYVQVVARLQLVATPSDTARQREADSARARILAGHGVTPEQLIEFAEVAGREPGRSRAIWEQVGVLVDSIRNADETGPDVPGDEAEGVLSRMRISTDEDSLKAPGIRAGQQAGRDGGVEEDPAAAAATTQLDSPQAVRGGGRGRPVAGQPVRRP